MKSISRRNFIRLFGAGAGSVAVSTSIISCASSDNGGQSSAALGPIPKGQVTKKGVAGIDKDVALIGYGGTRLPMLESPKRGESPVDQEAFNELIDRALEYGINYFDTAPMYAQGWSESALGEALSRHPRDSYFIATKMSNQGLKEPTLEKSKEMYYESFKRLKVDYFDYYLLHTVGRGEESFNNRFVDNKLIDFLLEERKAGRIRHLGWSFHGSHEAFDHLLSLHDKYHWDFILIQLNYYDWNHNLNVELLYNKLEKYKMPIVVMQPLQGGRLNNLPNHIVKKLKEQDPQSSVASWAFRFAGSKPLVFCVLSGMLHMEHIEDNIRTYSPLKVLTTNEEEFLEETAQLLAQYPSIPCNDCDYCMPCPYGIDIPNIFGHYNKCVNEGYVVNSKMDENYKKARRAYLVSYDRTVEKLRQADRCIGCNECSKHCPQYIDIPKQLKRVNSFIEKLKQDTL